MNNYKNPNESYKIYFVFFVLLSLIISYYSIAFIVKKHRDCRKADNEDYLLFYENYENKDKSNRFYA